MKPKNIIKIEEQIKQKEKELLALANFISKAKSNMTIRCVCGKMHKIKDLDVYEPYRWSQSYNSYEDGEYKSMGLYFRCLLDSIVVNGIEFSHNYKIPYEYQTLYNNNPEEQFKRYYKTLFKSNRDFKRDQENLFKNDICYKNLYIYENREKFGLIPKNKYYDKEGKEYITC